MKTMWLVFGVYILAILVLSELSARFKIKSLDDFLLAGRQHGTLITAGTLAATAIGAGSTIGAAGVAYFVGLSAAWYLLSAAVGFILLGITLGPALRRLSLYTIPQYIEQRYGNKAGLLAAGLGIIALVLFLAAQLYAMGALVKQFIGLSLDNAIVLSGLVVILYTWRGGNWAIHWSDNLQLIWIIIGVLLAAGQSLQAAGGLNAFSDPPVVSGAEAMGKNWFNPITRESVQGWNLFSLGDTIVAWVIMSTTWHFAMQSTTQRLLSARDARTTQRACLLAGMILIPLALLIGMTGMASRILNPGLGISTGMEQAAALPALVIDVLSPVLAGIVLGALVAVIMSTSDGALLGASTLIVKDIYPRLSKKDRTDAGWMKFTRTLTGVIGLAAMVCALIAPTLVQMLEVVAAIYCVSLFVPLVFGLYWKSANEAGAVTSMLVSGLIGLTWRMFDFETATGIHMLNLSLPLALVTMVGTSLLSAKFSKTPEQD